MYTRNTPPSKIYLLRNKLSIYNKNHNSHNKYLNNFLKLHLTFNPSKVSHLRYILNPSNRKVLALLVVGKLKLLIRHFFLLKRLSNNDTRRRVTNWQKKLLTFVCNTYLALFCISFKADFSKSWGF